MTKEEFLEGVNEMLADFNDPNGEIHEIKTTFSELSKELAEHDPVLGAKILAVSIAIQAVGDYLPNARVA